MLCFSRQWLHEGTIVNNESFHCLHWKPNVCHFWKGLGWWSQFESIIRMLKWNCLTQTLSTRPQMFMSATDSLPEDIANQPLQLTSNWIQFISLHWLFSIIYKSKHQWNDKRLFSLNISQIGIWQEADFRPESSAQRLYSSVSSYTDPTNTGLNKKKVEVTVYLTLMSLIRQCLPRS